MRTLDDKKRYPAGKAHYPGNVEFIVGEVKGPLTYGGLVIATAADFDPATARTTVEFSHCIAEDVNP